MASWDMEEVVTDLVVSDERLASVQGELGKVAILDIQTRSRVGEIGERGTAVSCADMNESTVVTAGSREDARFSYHMRVYCVENKYTSIGATGAFKWVQSNVMESVRIVDNDRVLSILRHDRWSFLHWNRTRLLYACSLISRRILSLYFLLDRLRFHQRALKTLDMEYLVEQGLVPHRLQWQACSRHTSNPKLVPVPTKASYAL